MARDGAVADPRGSILALALVCGVFVTATTELLNAWRWLTPGPMLVTWGAGVLAMVIWRARGCSPRGPRLPAVADRLSRLDLAMIGWIVTVMLLTFLTAVLSVPTTWDSMTYQVARVAHWTQNQSVSFYPTHLLRQLWQPPWAAFAMLHLFLLSGGDRLLNLVQWCSMVGSVLGTSLIARQLGACTRGQILTALVCATIPMGILQSSSTQSDYVAAFWLVCLVYTLIGLESAAGPGRLLAAGASLGLALLTKGTANIFAPPFVLFFVLVGSNRSAMLKCKQGLVIGLCALALNGPHYLRTFDLFGSILGPGGEGSEYKLANTEFSVPIWASNVIRNIGLHVGTPWLEVNTMTMQAISGMHALIGIAMDDPRSTWPLTRFAVNSPVAHEDFAGNGLHVLLFTSVALIVVRRWRSADDRRILGYVACLCAAFLMFSAVLKWQPWHSRLQLPLFVLGVPLVGVVFQRLDARVVAIVSLVLAGSSCYYLTQNESRPLLGQHSVLRITRHDQRLASSPPGYLDATRVLTATGCDRVGLVMGGDDREYPLWDLLPEVRRRGRFEHVLVTNVSARLTSPGGADFRPCAVIRIGRAPLETLTLDGHSFVTAWSRDEMQVLVGGGSVPRTATRE